jgi:DNA topoisomerase-1
VGNTEYAKQNGSFGLTTLRDKHARTQGSRLTLCFPGKSGVAHQVEIDDPRLAKAVRRCRDLPGYELFQYVDETGTHRKVDSSMVNDYLRETMGDEFTAKDFRTWQGTLEAAIVMSAIPRPKTETAMQKAISGAICDVAERLGNRPATCRKFYIHPAIVDAFEKGSLPPNLKRSTRTVPSRGLSKVERTVIKLLR